MFENELSIVFGLLQLLLAFQYSCLSNTLDEEDLTAFDHEDAFTRAAHQAHNSGTILVPALPSRHRTIGAPHLRKKKYAATPAAAAVTELPIIRPRAKASSVLAGYVKSMPSALTTVWLTTPYLALKSLHALKCG